MTRSRIKTNGFTLIELLTVIAIIAILAAIAFPVFSRMAENTRQGTCMSQLHDIGMAVKQYQMDNGKYPVSLLGLTDQAAYLPLMTGQKYLKDRNIFHCPDNTNNDAKAATPAVYPDNVPLSGQVAFTEAVAHSFGNESLANSPMSFYLNSYDVGPKVDKEGNAVQNNGQPVIELHYSLDWTGVVSPDDKQNQLKYKDPPEDHTVITWCTYHVATAHASIVPVLMLTGNAKPVPVSRFVGLGPLNF
jgi:prepilin-type N-terminal cleavage/methylation domain-containing protein